MSIKAWIMVPGLTDSMGLTADGVAQVLKVTEKVLRSKNLQMQFGFGRAGQQAAAIAVQTLRLGKGQLALALGDKDPTDILQLIGQTAMTLSGGHPEYAGEILFCLSSRTLPSTIMPKNARGQLPEASILEVSLQITRRGDVADLQLLPERKLHLCE